MPIQTSFEWVRWMGVNYVLRYRFFVGLFSLPYLLAMGIPSAQHFTGDIESHWYNVRSSMGHTPHTITLHTVPPSPGSSHHHALWCLTEHYGLAWLIVWLEVHCFAIQYTVVLSFLWRGLLDLLCSLPLLDMVNILVWPALWSRGKQRKEHTLRFYNKIHPLFLGKNTFDLSVPCKWAHYKLAMGKCFNCRNWNFKN